MINPFQRSSAPRSPNISRLVERTRPFAIALKIGWRGLSRFLRARSQRLRQSDVDEPRLRDMQTHKPLSGLPSGTAEAAPNTSEIGPRLVAADPGAKIAPDFCS